VSIADVGHPQNEAEPPSPRAATSAPRSRGPTFGGVGGSSPRPRPWGVNPQCRGPTRARSRTGCSGPNPTA